MPCAHLLHRSTARVATLSAKSPMTTWGMSLFRHKTKLSDSGVHPLGLAQWTLLCAFNVQCVSRHHKCRTELRIWNLEWNVHGHSVCLGCCSGSKYLFAHAVFPPLPITIHVLKYKAHMLSLAKVFLWEASKQLLDLSFLCSTHCLWRHWQSLYIPTLMA